MDIEKSALGHYVVKLSAQELAFLTNAINETLESLDDEEFHSRTGFSVEEAERLATQLADV